MPNDGARVDYERGWTTWDDMKRFGPMSRHTRRILRRFLRPLDFASVLDVGCGQGECLRLVAEMHPSARLTGVDVSTTAVDLARSRLPSATLRTLDVQAEALPETFDLVLCLDVLEHLPDDVSALRRLRSMTGRWLLASTLQGEMRPFETQMGHVRNYARGELEEKLRGAGLRPLEVLQWGWPFYSPIYRGLNNALPASATTGGFGPMRRLACHLLYALFLLNSHRRGDYLWVLSEPA